eukprot:1799873-Rhodomonas_salina.1
MAVPRDRALCFPAPVPDIVGQHRLYGPVVHIGPHYVPWARYVRRVQLCTRLAPNRTCSSSSCSSDTTTSGACFCTAIVPPIQYRASQRTICYAGTGCSPPLYPEPRQYHTMV